MLVSIFAFFQLTLFLIGIVGPWRDTPGSETSGRLPRLIRMLLSFSLVAAALTIWFGAKQTPYAQWVAFGMLVSFIGDLVMARLIRLPNRLIGGMIAFGIAHALYITAYVQTIQANGGTLWNSGFWFGIFFYGTLTIFFWWFQVRNPQKGTAINLGALVYGLWITLMASFAHALAVALGGVFWLTAIGGVWFIISDSLIGATDIRGTRIQNANDWIWFTYVGAQAGIIYAGGI